MQCHTLQCGTTLFLRARFPLHASVHKGTARLAALHFGRRNKRSGFSHEKELLCALESNAAVQKKVTKNTKDGDEKKLAKYRTFQQSPSLGAKLSDEFGFFFSECTFVKKGQCSLHRRRIKEHVLASEVYLTE